VCGSAAWVGIAAMMHLFLAFKLVSEERARPENLLTSDNNDSLAIEQLLGYNACKASQQVIATVNDNLFFEHA
jgi:hypothetical protein